MSNKNQFLRRTHTALSWFFGIISLIFGIPMLFESIWTACFFFLIAWLLLPPIRTKLYSDSEQVHDADFPKDPLNTTKYLFTAVVSLMFMLLIFVLFKQENSQPTATGDMAPKPISSPTSGEPPELMAFEEFYVTASELNVRLSPSSNGKITNVLYRGQLVHVFELENGWSRISEYYDGLIEGIDGKVARWVFTKHISKEKPTVHKPKPNNDLEAALNSSDDYQYFSDKFIKVSEELIRTGACSIEDFDHVGGWVRSVNYKPRKVYFTYCDTHNKMWDRIYFDPKTGKVFR